MVREDGHVKSFVPYKIEASDESKVMSLLYSSYLPRLLCDYLEEQRAETVFPPSGEPGTKLFLLNLRYFVYSGYYRAAIWRTREVYQACNTPKEIGLAADIFCGLRSFGKLAYSISYSLELSYERDSLLARECIRRLNPAAFRFIKGPFPESSAVDEINSALLEMEYYPGYLEALCVDTHMASDLPSHLMPRSYREIWPNGVSPYCEQHACDAVHAGNYRLARYLKANYFGKDSMARVIKILKRQKLSPSGEVALAWLSSEGWLTPEEEAQIRNAWKAST